MKKLVLFLALLMGISLAGPATAYAEVPQQQQAKAVGLRVLAVAHEHIWLGGAKFNIYVNDYGDCDSAGYSKELPNSWKSRVSSISIAPGSYCSMINVWKKTGLNTNSHVICYSGQLPAYNLAASKDCNDNVWGVQVYKGPRRG